VRSVLASSPPESTQLLLWDNGSDKETTDLIKSLARDAAKHTFKVWLHFAKLNHGFGVPVNRMSTKAAGDYFVILNSDTEVGPGWLEALRKPFLKKPMVGATAPAGGCHSLDGSGEGHPGACVEYLEGSCLMIPLYLFRRIAGFRVDLFPFAYAEDSDMGLRLRERGYSLEEVDVPGYLHHRAKTSQAVKAGYDLRGRNLRNNAKLTQVWQSYLKTAPGDRQVPQYINGELQPSEPVVRTFERAVKLKRSGAIGDCLWLTALARSIHDVRPHWKLYADTPFPELFEGNPLIATTGAPDTAEVIDLDGAYEGTTEGHFVEHYAMACGLPEAPLRLPEVYLTEEEKAWSLEKRMGASKLAVIHSTPTTWPGKNLPSETVNEVIDRLRIKSWQVLSVGINMELTLRESISLIGCADLFIGPDSFPATAAYAMRTPAVVCFGAVPPERVLLETAYVESVRSDWHKCLGCHLDQPVPRVSSGCLVQKGKDPAPCMKAITPAMVIDAAIKVLKRVDGIIEWSKNPGLFKDLELTGPGLDLCCGTKRFPKATTFDRFPMFHVDAIGDVKQGLPFANGQFSWVLTSHSLEDLECPDYTVREIRRVLRPGGKAIVYVPLEGHYKGYNEDHCRLFTLESIVDLLERNGLKVGQVTTDVDDGRYSVLAVGEK